MTDTNRYAWAADVLERELDTSIDNGTIASQASELGMDEHSLVTQRREFIEELRETEPMSSVHDADAVTASGQGLAEYALILALIAVIAIVALIFLGGQVSSILSTIGDSI